LQLVWGSWVLCGWDLQSWWSAVIPPQSDYRRFCYYIGSILGISTNTTAKI
jgi:hypothetical protein